MAVFATAISALVSSLLFLGPSRVWALTSWDEAAIDVWQAAQVWAADVTVLVAPPTAVVWIGAAVLEAGALMLWATHHVRAERIRGACTGAVAQAACCGALPLVAVLPRVG